MSHRVECIVDGCTGVCEGETEAEVMSEVEAHVKEAHPDLELDEDTVQAVEAEIQPA